MAYYIVNRNQTRNPGLHHEVHTLEHANKLGITNRIILGLFSNEVAAVARAKIYYQDADGCATCCPKAHRGVIKWQYIMAVKLVRQQKLWLRKTLQAKLKVQLAKL